MHTKRILVLQFYMLLTIFLGIGFLVPYNPQQPSVGGIPIGSSVITLDASCTGSSGSAQIQPCSSAMTVSAGDTITCEAYTNGASFDASDLVFNDTVNGFYSGVYGYNHPTSTTHDWVAAAVFENSAGGSITPQAQNYEADGIGISCQAWKGTPTAGTLDGGSAISITKSATGTNPTAGTAGSPTNTNEAIICQMVRATAATTSNSSPWLPSGTLTGVTQTLAQYFQYMIQTAAAAENCNYTSASAAYRDTQFALVNSANTGYRGLTGVYAVANAQTNGATASLTILNTISGATAGSLTALAGSGAAASNWSAGSSSVVFKTGSSTCPLGSLKLAVGQQGHTVGDAATCIQFPASVLATGLSWGAGYTPTPGTGNWLGMFVNVEGALTTGQGCDITAIDGGIDGAITLQLNYQATSGACTGLNSGMCLDLENGVNSGTGAALTTTPNMAAAQPYFVIIHEASVNEANHEIYVFYEATPGTLPWVLLGHSTYPVTSTPTATTTATVTGTALTVTSGTGIATGQFIAMTGIQTGTSIASGSGTSWVLSQPATTNQSSAVTANFWTLSGGNSFVVGKYSSCSLSNNVDFSGIIFDPWGILLPLIAAGTVIL